MIYEEVNVEALKQKAKYFYGKNLKVHIKFKQNFWKNGSIKEINEDHFIIDENIEGEMPIFWLEIKDLEEFKEKSRRPYGAINY